MSNRFSLPALTSGILLLVLSLWSAYSIFEAISSKREVRNEFARETAALRNLVEKGKISSKTFDDETRRRADRLFSEIESKHTRLLFHLYVAECAAVLLFFLTWYHYVRTEEFRKRLEEEKNRKTEIDELGLAAAGLAHETKNPLGVIRGLAQNIADDEFNSEKTRGKAREIMEETDVTTARLGDFLSYARFRTPTPEQVDARALLERIVSLLADDFAGAGVELKKSLVQIDLLVDPDMLSQVVMNLLTNSLKFTPEGGRVTLSLDIEDAEFATIAVADTGTGIPAAILPEVFKPYVTKRRGGYGIGLAIVKRIADQAGWSIAMDSKEGEGTTVSLKRIPQSNTR